MFVARFLGKFEVELDGVPVQINSRSSQSLLAYLAVNAGTAFRREKLAGMLWPETLESSARSNLRGALFRIRRSFAEAVAEHSEVLVADDITISFDDQVDHSLDVHQFVAKVEADATNDDLENIVSLYDGELLPGFYDDWVVLERERLQAIFEQRIGLLIERLVGTQEWPGVLDWSERWIALSGAPEPAYRGLMLAHAAQGDYSGLSSAYARCGQAMQRELGLDPSETTHLLYQQLQAGGKADAAAALQLVERLQESPQLSDGGALSKAVDETPEHGEAPYKGLNRYEQTDAALFFGRKRLIEDLTSRIARSDSIVVVGASGSGKSSLVRAGLIPSLVGQSGKGPSKPRTKRRAWRVLLIEPGSQPLQALALGLHPEVEDTAAARAALKDDPRYALETIRSTLKSKLLLAVDQFEELFTMCRDPVEREAFVSNILTAAEDDEINLLITLRADFYAHCAEFPRLREMLSSSQVYIGRMTAEELRQVIEGPAEMGRWGFEPGLVDLILRDVIREPGALPLLSHALLETWGRRKARTLTLEGYAQSGGVRGAIARTAEKVYNVGLDTEQQRIARQIFLRLTEFGEGAQPTRRQASLSELASDPAQGPAVQEVLTILANTRLITIDEDKVDVAHEALIVEWPALRQWLMEDRESFRIHRHLTDSAQSWDEMDRDPSELYQGTRLSQALEWSDQHKADLNMLERSFLDASRERAELRETEREAQRKRELQAAKDLAEEQSKRADAERQMAEEQRQAFSQLRRRALYLGGALVFAVVMAGTALFLAERVRQVALTAQANAAIAEKESVIAFARELAAASISNQDQDPELSILLALQAVSQAQAAGLPVPREAEEALRSSLLATRLRATFSGGYDVDFSPDGNTIAASGLGSSAVIRDLETGRELASFSGHSRDVYGVGVEFSSDGKWLLTDSADGTAKLWDVTRGTERAVFEGHTDGVFAAAFSPDGKQAGTIGQDGTVRIWNVDTGREVLRIEQPGASNLSFAPRESEVAIAIDWDGTANLRVIDIDTAGDLWAVNAHELGSQAVAYSQDGAFLVSAGSDAMIRLWDASTGTELLAIFNDAPIQSLAISTDGSRIATGSNDGVARVWDVEAEEMLFEFSGHSDVVSAVDFSPDGRFLATSGFDHTTNIWDISRAGEREWLTLAGHDHVVFSVDFSSDGRRIATSSWDHSAVIWDAYTGEVLRRFSDFEGEVARAALSPDGRYLATADFTGALKLWEANTGEPVYSIAAHAPGDMDVAFSPDGSLLASAGADGLALLWDAADGIKLAEFSGHTDVINRLAFSADGSLLGTASWDDTTRIWDVSSGRELLTIAGVVGDAKNVDFSPDGSMLATAHADETARIWQLSQTENGLSARELHTLTGHGSTVWDATFTPEGSRLATISFDGTVRMWDVETGTELLALSGSLNGPDVDFDPEGKYLAATSGNGNAYVFVLDLQELVELAKSRVSRQLTRDECQRFLHVDACPGDT